MENTKERCGNCKYFDKFYYNKNGKFLSTSLGNCKRTKSYNKNLEYEFECCKFWESEQPKTQHRDMCIASALYDMAEKLDHFAQVIKENKSE